MSYFTAADHLAAVAAAVVLSVALCLAGRMRPGSWMRSASRLLGAALILNQLYYQYWLIARGGWTAQYDLPLYLCDIAGFTAGIALWWPKPLMVELTYFWALAGTLQGLLTPDALYVFPTYQYWEFYIDHVGVVVAACVLVIGQRRYPREHGAMKVFGITAAFTAFVGAVDAVTGANYMYLRHVPGSGSALSLMGAWPWYIVSGVVVAAILLTILDMPFWSVRRHSAAEASAQSA